MDMEYFIEDLRQTAKLEGRSNYCWWRKRLMKIFELYNMHALLETDDSFDYDMVTPEEFRYVSSLIQSTFSKDLKFHVWAELAEDPRILWKEVQDRYECKGKWACIMFTIQLKQMRPAQYADHVQFLLAHDDIAIQRTDTGVEMTNEIREMVAIAMGLPKHLSYFLLKWSIAKEEDLTPEKMEEQVSMAKQRLHEEDEAGEK